MHAVTRAHAKIQSVANKMRVHAWSQKSVKGGVRRRRSLSCLFFDTLRNLSYGWCLVEKRRLLTRRRRHVVQGRVPLPTTTLCSLQKGRPEPSFPRAGTSCATRTAYARRTGQTLVASGGEPNARPPRVGPQQPKQKGGPTPALKGDVPTMARACPVGRPSNSQRPNSAKSPMSRCSMLYNAGSAMERSRATSSARNLGSLLSEPRQHRRRPGGEPALLGSCRPAHE